VLRVGVLGAARITPTALVKPARRTKKATVVAVAARDRNRAVEFATKHHVARVHDSYEELINDPEIDAVYNPLPNGLHGYWTIAALKAGKHVLCEKPFTANADEARSVAEATGAHPGLVVMEAFHYQYHPLTRRLVEIVSSGELGPVSHIDVSFSAPLWKKGDIRYQLALAGGAIMDMGPGPPGHRRQGQAVLARGGPGHGRPLLPLRRRQRAHRLLHVLLLGVAHARSDNG
jgi:predicted dehydrogenase